MNSALGVGQLPFAPAVLRFLAVLIGKVVPLTRADSRWRRRVGAPSLVRGWREPECP